jgi:hypothetical protein
LPFDDERVRSEHSTTGAARSAAAARQQAVDAVLPAFLFQAPEGDLRRSSLWTNLADLALGLGSQWVGDDSSRTGIGYVRDLVAPGALGLEPSERVLPRGSRLRLLEPFYEMWGYGYVAETFHDLAVETGALAGRMITVGDYARTSWANGLPRRTLAAALIVPAEAPDAEGSGAGLQRYERAVAALRDAGAPVTRTDGLPVEPLVREGDIEALA